MEAVCYFEMSVKGLPNHASPHTKVSTVRVSTPRSAKRTCKHYIASVTGAGVKCVLESRWDGNKTFFCSITKCEGNAPAMRRPSESFTFLLLYLVPLTGPVSLRVEVVSIWHSAKFLSHDTILKLIVTEFNLTHSFFINAAEYCSRLNVNS
jgi:hypothetical protein